MQRAVRGFASGSLLYLSALVAHHLGGGQFVTGRTLLVSTILSISFSTLAASSDIEGPRLLSLILVSQLVGHMVLGGNSANSTTMYVNHIILGFLSFVLISNLDRALLWLAHALTLPNPPLSLNLRFKVSSSSIFPSEDFSFNKRFPAFQYWTTSPPLVATFI
jgi:hypothetical protein